MKHMETNIIKSLKIFFLFMKANFLTGLEYRFDFITGVIPTVTYMFGYFVFIGVIFSKVQEINGWTFNQMLTLFALEQILFYGSYLFFKPSLTNFSELIRNGTLDSSLRLPANTRLLVSFKDQTPDMLPSVVVALAFLIYSVQGLSLSWLNILSCIFLSICGFFILYNVMFILASLAFWVVESDELVDLAGEISQLGRFPPSIFPLAAQFFMFIVVPAFLIVFVPATALLGILDVKFAALAVAMAAATYLVSKLVWQQGLKQYSSASS